MTKKIPIAVADGDGIGPEIMAATLHILKHVKAPLEIKKVHIGESMYLKGHPTGMESCTWDILRNTKAFLKAPITTPQGGGYKSLNVTIRTTLGLYANVRPCVSYSPFVATKHPKMDVVIVRENEEDLYTGIEYRQTPDVYHALKVMTRPGSEKIIRYAFEYARSNKRKKVTCFTKDNILKLTDGLFHKVFEEVAKEYPDIINEHWIVDIGSAKLADTPEDFDVIVLPNLYGDILSDVAAQITGSVGLAGSANIGELGAMFEAIHGSAPKRAGQNVANPSGLLLASVMMLVHLKLPDLAALVHNAWLATIEEGVHTYDIFKPSTSKKCVSTTEFADEVVKRLGKQPHTLTPVAYENAPPVAHLMGKQNRASKKETIGVDVFIEFKQDVDELVKRLQPACADNLFLELIANRGTNVFPEKAPETFCVDSWRCRFVHKEKQKPIIHEDIVKLLGKLTEAKLDFTHTENLCVFDGSPGYRI